MVWICVSDSINWAKNGLFRQKLNVWIRQYNKRCDPSRFLPLCFLIACRAARLNFSPNFLHILSALCGNQIKKSRKTRKFIFSFKHIATKVKKWLIWFHVLWVLTYDSCHNPFVCLLLLKLNDLCRQTQRKPENTVYLSTFTNLLRYLTAMQTLLLGVQAIRSKSSA